MVITTEIWACVRSEAYAECLWIFVFMWIIVFVLIHLTTRESVGTAMENTIILEILNMWCFVFLWRGEEGIAVQRDLFGREKSYL